MNSRRERLWMQRQALVAQSGVLRDRLELHVRALAPLGAVADRAWRAGQWVREHPWVPALAALLLFWRRPRQIWRWGRRAWGAWRLVQRVAAAWAAASVVAKFR